MRTPFDHGRFGPADYSTLASAVQAQQATAGATPHRTLALACLEVHGLPAIDRDLAYERNYIHKPVAELKAILQEAIGRSERIASAIPDLPSVRSGERQALIARWKSILAATPDD